MITIESLALEIFELCNNRLLTVQEILNKLQEKYSRLSNNSEWQYNLIKYRRTFCGLEKLSLQIKFIIDFSEEYKFVVVTSENEYNTHVLKGHFRTLIMVEPRTNNNTLELLKIEFKNALPWICSDLYNPEDSVYVYIKLNLVIFYQFN